jgi:hypothetical protein
MTKLFLLFFALSLIISADDSIVSSPYWHCDTCADTTIEKVLSKPRCVEVYYRVERFRMPATHWVKVFKIQK